MTFNVVSHIFVKICTLTSDPAPLYSKYTDLSSEHHLKRLTEHGYSVLTVIQVLIIFHPQAFFDIFADPKTSQLNYKKMVRQKILLSSCC